MENGVATGYGDAGIQVTSGRKPCSEWLALMPGRDEGYVDWEKAEAIRRTVSDNVLTSRHYGAPKQGDALSGGACPLPVLRTQATVRDSGMEQNILRHSCSRGSRQWAARCIAFGGLRVDDAIEVSCRRSSSRARLQQLLRRRTKRACDAIRSVTH